MRKTADQVVAPVLPYEPVFPHVGIIPKNPGAVSTMLYQYALTLLPPLSIHPLLTIKRAMGNAVDLATASVRKICPATSHV